MGFRLEHLCTKAAPKPAAPETVVPVAFGIDREALERRQRLSGQMIDCNHACKGGEHHYDEHHLFLRLAEKAAEGL